MRKREREQEEKLHYDTILLRFTSITAIVSRVRGHIYNMMVVVSTRRVPPLKYICDTPQYSCFGPVEDGVDGVEGWSDVEFNVFTGVVAVLVAQVVVIDDVTNFTTAPINDPIVTVER